jgi:hypothetical protein
MTMSLKLDRRAVLRGFAGTALALPVLEAMGAEIIANAPRRFCALYTANGMSLPKPEHGIDDWSWFPTKESEGRFELGKSTEPLKPFSDQISFFGGLFHENGTKADPHVCSDMWLTGAPLRSTPSGSIRSSHSTPSSTAANPLWSFRSMQELVFYPEPEPFRTTSKAARYRLRVILDESSIDCSASIEPR